jgi:hypothetical protein
MTEPAVLQILKWAAGAPENLDSVRSVDEDALMDLVASHNLYTRFFRRIQAERPRWASRTMSIRAFTRNKFAKQRIQQQIASLWEIVQAVPTNAGPIIPIKGLSLHALTGETDNIRISGDIDVFAEDPEGVWAAMTSLGYATEEKHDEGSHFAVMNRGGVQFEIHRSFPVWAYPPGLAAADMQPESHPGVWRQPFSDIRETSTQYRDIAAEVCPGVAPQTQGLTVPNPAMAALLLCVHAFRHYVEGHALDSPIVRLGELADIHDLMRHPQFDYGRFQSLVSLFSAHDAVRFVQYLSHLYLEAEASKDLWNAEMTPFPMLLSSWGGWTAPHAPDALLYRLNPKEVFDRLTPNPVTAGGWHCTAACDPEEAAGAQGLPRMIVQSVAQEQLPVRLFVRWESDALRFDVEILRPLPNGYRYQVLVYYPYKFQGTRPAGCEVPYSNVQWTEADCEARLSFLWSDLPLAFSRDNLVPIMVLVMKIRDDQPSNVCFREDTLLMLPLHITPTPPQKQ